MTPLQQAELFFKAGNFAEAYKELATIKKGSVEKDLLLAKCAIKLGNGPLAVLSFSNVLAKEAGHAFAASHLAALYVNSGQSEKAADVLKKALKANPDEKMRCEYGVLLWTLGQKEQGLAEVSKAIQRKPDFDAARMQRVTMLASLKLQEAAVEDLRILIERNPGNTHYLQALGTVEFLRARYEQAVEHLGRVVALQPGNGQSLKSLAISQTMAGHIEESYVTLSRLKEVDPKLWQEVVASTGLGNQAGEKSDFDPRPLFLSIVYQEQQQCNWSRRGKYEEVFRHIVAQPGSIDIGPIVHYMGIMDLDNSERLKAMKDAGAAAARGITAYQHPVSAPAGKTRIGYVMPNMKQHVVTNIVRELIAAHDVNEFDVHVFCTHRSEADMLERYRAIPGLNYEDIKDLTDTEAAARIHEKKIDVLVDMAIYNDGGRPGIMAHRPAPIQVNYLGAPFTSGAEWMDYIITDDMVSPGPGWCTEAEARLPGCFFVYGHEDETPPAVPPRSQLGLPEQEFLFSAMNNSYKIDPQSFASWMRILKETPGSRLLLKTATDIPANLTREAEQQGVDPQRLLFVPLLPSGHDYLLRQGMPDLFLDTRIYGAHTTLAESLWMGVPGISCPGQSFPSRVGSSLLASCGLHELIVPDWRAYEDLAIALFHDPERLQCLRETLRQSRLKAAPFDIRGQASALEKAYRHMVERRAAGLACATFRVAEL